MDKSMLENAVLGMAFRNRNDRITKNEIVKRTKFRGSSSSIIERIIETLEEQKIIKRDKRSYVLTAAGKMRMAPHFRKIKLAVS